MTDTSYAEELIKALKPLAKFWIIFAVIGGIIAIFVGVAIGIWGNSTNKFEMLWAQSLKNIGAATLGAGIFAAVLKSRLYVEVFQKILASVIRDPANYNTRSELMVQWERFTQALLKSVLPDSYLESALERLRTQYLGPDITFHYEEYDVLYEVAQDSEYPKELSRVTVKTVLKAKMSVPPGADIDNIFFEGSVRVTSDPGQVRVTDLLVNGKRLEDKHYEATEIPNERRLRLPWRSLTSDTSRPVSLERTTIYKQDLSKEPYFVTEWLRYVKRLTVRIKAPHHFAVYGKFMGSPNLAFCNPVRNDEELVYLPKLGRNSLEDSGLGDYLILPGHGFILILSPKGALELPNE